MTMKERLRSRVAELTSIIGVSGHEWDVAKYIFDAIKDDVDTIEQLPNGIIVATKKGAHPGPRVMVSAHMDEVGYEVKTVSPQGYLYFDQIGGATIACLPGRRVLVKGEKGVVKGVVGIRAGHLLTPEQIAKAQTVTQSYVDICVGSREEAEALGIHAGAQIVPDSPLESIGPDGDYICTRAADCRALCAVIIETLKELKYPCEYGLFLDTIPCGDVPDVDFGKELPVALKKGPVLLHSQLFMGLGLRAGSHPKLVEAVRNAAEKTGANHQEFAFNGAGYVTDAVGAVLTGMAVVSLALPRRYSHSPVELFHMNDICDTQKTVEEFLKNEVDLGLLHK